LILSFLEDLDISDSQRDTLLLEFQDKSISKITKEKVIKKLEYIKLANILERFEKELNILFINDLIEFYHQKEISLKIIYQ